MIFGWSRGVKSLAHQARDMRRLHVFSWLTFGLIAGLLVLTTIFGSNLFIENTQDKEPAREALSFENINEDAPIPLLLRHSSNTAPKVSVKGETITKEDLSPANSYSPPTTLSDNYIRAFTFATSTNEFGVSVSASWNVKASNGSTLYVISETDNSRNSELDNEVYSIAGDNLERSSRTFQLPSIQRNLYLEVFQLTASGEYEIVDVSPLISIANSEL